MQLTPSLNLLTQNQPANRPAADRSNSSEVNNQKLSFEDALKKNLSARSQNSSTNNTAQNSKSSVESTRTTESETQEKGSSLVAVDEVDDKSKKSDRVTFRETEGISKGSVQKDEATEPPSAADQLIMMIAAATYAGAPAASQTEDTAHPVNSKTTPALADLEATSPLVSMLEVPMDDAVGHSGATSENENIASSQNLRADRADTFKSIIEGQISANPSKENSNTGSGDTRTSQPDLTTSLQVLSNPAAKEQPLPLSKDQFIATPIGNDKWGHDVGQKISWMVKADITSATLTLNPPDLGPMKVVISVENDQAHAKFSADQPEVRQAILDSMPKLREAMSDAGISLGQTTVSDLLSNGQHKRDNRDHPVDEARNDISPGFSETELLSTANSPLRSNGLIDTFV